MMNMPSSMTFKILEERRNYLILKQKRNILKNAYLEKEIEALDRVMKFTKLALNNLPRYFIRILLKIDEDKKSKYNKAEDNKNQELKYFYEKYINKHLKLDISFIQTEENKYILLYPKKYKQDKLVWEKIDQSQLDLEILEELIKKWEAVFEETDEIKK